MAALYDPYLHFKIWPPILGYMLLGLLLFEYSYFRLQSVRNINEQRDSNYPPFRRQDVHNWRRWKFYPGALTIMPLRLIIMAILGILTYLCIRIVTIGYNFESGKAMTGCRGRTVRGITAFFSRALLIATCMRYSVRKVDFDYTQYLGKDYKEK